MSVPPKRVTNADTGNTDLIGGDDWDALSDYMNNVDKTGPVVINTATRYRSGKFAVRNPLNTASYITAGSAIVADRTVTEPLLAANDERVYKNHAVTLASKTLDATCDISAVAATTSVKGAVELATDGEIAANVVVQGNDSRLDTQRPMMYIPMFIYPNPLTDWQRVADLKTLVPHLQIVATMNVNNGDGVDNTHPFAARDTDFGNGITLLDNAGVKVIAYVYTGYGVRSAAVVKACIDAYVTYYPEIRGIFFDEMDNVTGHEAYYADLEAYVKTTKGLEISVGNPGTETLASYAEIFDTVLVYEDSGMPSEGDVITATLAGAVPRRRFGIIPYNVSSFTTYGLRTLMKYASTIYVQSDTLPNPWDTLPSYLELLAITIGNAK